jgi:hypothetical protein
MLDNPDHSAEPAMAKKGGIRGAADKRPTVRSRASTKNSNATDLNALRAAVVDAATVSAGLWFSYLFVLFYLAIAVGGIRHRDLFFENPVKLPFLNVELPLVGFFALAPGLFVIVHAYVLIHFVLLAGKAGLFHSELDEKISNESARERERRHLLSNIFVQFLAGPREIRTGIIGLMLRLIAQITLVAGPIALLVLFQLQFLPYHHEGGSVLRLRLTSRSSGRSGHRSPLAGSDGSPGAI